MTKESEHYMCASKVNKSPTTSLDPETVIRYKHISRPDLPRAIVAMFPTTAEHIVRILLASNPDWWPHGELQHNVA
jgi:hypothetical protein